MNMTGFSGSLFDETCISRNTPAKFPRNSRKIPEMTRRLISAPRWGNVDAGSEYPLQQTRESLLQTSKRLHALSILTESRRTNQVLSRLQTRSKGETK